MKGLFWWIVLKNEFFFGGGGGGVNHFISIIYIVKNSIFCPKKLAKLIQNVPLTVILMVDESSLQF
jgi:hypothetical protein